MRAKSVPVQSRMKKTAELGHFLSQLRLNLRVVARTDALVGTLLVVVFVPCLAMSSVVPSQNTSIPKRN